MTTTNNTPSDDGQNLRAEGQEPTFYARVPKMAIEDLGPYELTLYVHYKQIAADKGSCFMSNRNLAKACGMSVSRLQRARTELARRHLITVTEQGAGDGSLPPVVTIRDVWEINNQRYGVSSEDGTATTKGRGVGTRKQPGVSQETGGLVPENNKEELLEEKELKITAPQAASGCALRKTIR
jgi:DNA-binding transcriptional MocR family regulator